MLLGIIGAVVMTVCSQLWTALGSVLHPEDYWIVHTLRLTANALTGLVLGLLIHRLQHLSATDSLTQVLNRNHFLPKLERLLNQSRRHGAAFSLVLIDLDRFKEHNDTYGHLAGDKILQEVAGKMRSLLGQSGIIARFGGDEFMILLPDSDTGRAEQTMQRIKDIVSTEILNGTNITISVGIATFPIAGDNGEKLLLAADAALYAAKAERDSIAHCGHCASPVPTTLES